MRSRPTPSRTFAALALLASLALVLAIAGCGGGSSSTAETGEAAESSNGGGSAGGQVEVTWQEPETAEDELGYELLQAAETEAVITQLAEEFELPHPLTVRGVNGYGVGPVYMGEDNSITLPYAFAAMAFEVMAEVNPEAGEEELEEQTIGVNSFILAHEFAHALVENFEFAVLGKEEDAADAISTYLLLQVSGGDEYAADAALFWAGLAEGVESHTITEYADSHSLDIQRAYNILCLVAGSGEEAFEEVEALEVLPAERLETCPGEFEQLEASLEKELG